MMRRQLIHEETYKEKNTCANLQSNEILKSKELPSDTNTRNIREVAEILQDNNTMAATVKVVVRLTVMTPKGRKFPPREPVTFDLTLPFPAKSGEQTTELQTIQDHVAAGFPRLQGEFTLLRKDDAGMLVPCDSQAELLKATEQSSDGQVQLYIQRQCNWQKFGANQAQCTNCTAAIHGMRVKCLECEDYYLCPQCHDVGNHGNHVMVRCNMPRFFHVALPLFAASLPKLCQEVREKNPGDNLPTLAPKDVRQFWQKERNQQDATRQEDDVTGAKRKAAEQEKPGFKKHLCGKTRHAVKCTNCSAAIEGMRVKCLECDDYNLCPLCDEQGAHSNHIMVKSHRPWFFRVALLRFAESLPNLCKEVREKHMGDNMPRLEPKEVRQFCHGEFKENNDAKQQGEHTKATTKDGDEERMVLKLTMRGRRQGVVQCSNCSTAIQGMRVKCLECDDYNLCPPCDEMGIHADHVMVKSDMPRFFNFGLPHYAEIIPQLCEKQKKDRVDGQIPRLERDDLRHFWRETKKVANPSHKGKCPERRQQMRKTWNKFLHDIAAEEMKTVEDDWQMVADEDQPDAQPVEDKVAAAASSECDELTTNVQKMDLGDAPAQDDEENREKLQHMKRQWMQKCHQHWKEQLGQIEEPEQANRKFHFKMWRPYMRHCWDLWRQQLIDAGMASEPLVATEMETQQEKSGNTQRHHNKGRRGVCYPRRQWIQNCWQLWRDEASKNVNKWIPDDLPSSDEETQDKPRRGPFPGYHFLMTKSWENMQEQMKHTGRDTRHKHTAARHEKDVSGSARNAMGSADTDDEVQPALAKHMLKRCWVNGSRQLWWMHAKKLMDLPDIEQDLNKSQTDAAGNDDAAINQEDVMKLMSTKPNWRSYMNQCWLLWHQLSKQAGLTIKHDMSSMTTQDSAEPQHPRQAWIAACWPQWNDDMRKSLNPDEARRPNAAGRGKPMWNKRPFSGWHPLITRSWQLMNADSEGKQENRQEVRMEQIRSMRAAWVKEVHKEMKQLSQQKKEAKDKDEERPRPARQDTVMASGSQDDIDIDIATAHDDEHSTPRTPNTSQQWQKNVDLQGKLMKQYWKLYKDQKDSEIDGSPRPDGGSRRMHRQQWRGQMRRVTTDEAASGDNTDETADDMRHKESQSRGRLRLTMKPTPGSQQGNI